MSRIDTCGTRQKREEHKTTSITEEELPGPCVMTLFIATSLVSIVFSLFLSFRKVIKTLWPPVSKAELRSKEVAEVCSRSKVDDFCQC